MDLRMIQNDPRDLEYATKLLRANEIDKRVIIYHERSNPVSSDLHRNTDVDWAKELINGLKGFSRVFVIPEYMSMSDQTSCDVAKVLHHSIYNLRLRSALAELAELNIFGPGGFHVTGA